ncbi:MAG TPA: hypothetical protein VMZ27_02490, partial [Candidatus Saccharimonadales bacterium]|nr:hypothetical protein [Candidatus Saccharimonadales bacterium]
SDIQTSGAFHQRLMGALRTEEREPAWRIIVRHLQGSLTNWRTGLPVAAVTIVVLFALVLHERQSVIPTPQPATVRNAPKSDPDPTISNYQMMANHSLEQLDDLLTRQGNHNLPSGPIYTASGLAQVNALE